jgi:hypothetical protein
MGTQDQNSPAKDATDIVDSATVRSIINCVRGSGNEPCVYVRVPCVLRAAAYSASVATALTRDAASARPLWRVTPCELHSSLLTGCTLREARRHMEFEEESCSLPRWLPDPRLVRSSPSV